MPVQIVLLAGACVAAGAEEQAARQPSEFGVSVSYAAIPAADFGGVPSGRWANARETQLAAAVPMVTDERTALTFGIDYQYTRFEYDGIAGRDRDLHRLQLPLRWHHRGDGWTMDAEVAAGLSTSSNVFNNFLKEASSEDTILTARVETAFPYHARGPRWLAGIAHDRTFGEPRLYPSFGAIFSLSPATSVRLAFPESAARYAASERQRWTLRLFPAGHEWHVASDELGAGFDYRAEAIRVEGTWSKKTRSTIWLEVSLGYEFRRRHRLIDDTGQQIDADLAPEMLVQIRFRMGEGANQVNRLLGPSPKRQQASNYVK